MEFLEAHPNVVPGLEQNIIKLAEHQSQYRTLPALHSDTGVWLTRWTLTEEQRQRVAAGQDVYLEIHSKYHPPVRVSVGDDTESAELAIQIGVALTATS